MARPLVVLDTNVLVSALRSGGVPHLILREVLKNKLRPVYSQEMMDEYEDVLNRDYLKLSPDRVAVVLDFIKQKGLKLNPDSVSFESADQDDRFFYEVFKACEQPVWLITGNMKHYPQEEGILLPREFYDHFLAQ